MLGFLAQGGRQVLLLGAGFDCRAARFRRELADAIVFEVDHPATQAKKRRVLAEVGIERDGVGYLAWDFESTPMSELPARLAALGQLPPRLTLTVWEGVSMYLTPAAIEVAGTAVGALSAEGSPFAFTYFDRTALERPPLRMHLLGAVAALFGEPLRFGGTRSSCPGGLPPAASRRSTAPTRTSPAAPRFSATFHGGLRHIAVAERSASP